MQEVEEAPTSSTCLQRIEMITIEPFADRVLVEPIEAPRQTHSGLIIPDAAIDRPQRGIVRAKGPGRWSDGKRTPIPCEVGDEVVYGKFAGLEIEIDGQKFLILSQSDLLGRVVRGDDRGDPVTGSSVGRAG